MIPESVRIALLFSALLLFFAAKRLPRHIIKLGQRLSMSGRADRGR
jgi:HAMP domain-containing protein